MRYTSCPFSLALPPDKAQFASRVSGPYGDKLDWESNGRKGRGKLGRARSLGWQWLRRTSTLHAAATSVSSERAGTAGDVTEQDGWLPHTKKDTACDPLAREAETHCLAVRQLKDWHMCAEGGRGWRMRSRRRPSDLAIHPSAATARAGSQSCKPSPEATQDRPLPIQEEEYHNPLLGLPVFGISTYHENEPADLHRFPQRNLPARGFKPATLLAIGGGVMLYGWYQFGKGAREQR